MKYIIVVPDGMADEPIEELDFKTPLEVAHTTNMDYMANKGYVGEVQTIPEGMAPGSDIGNMAILGYDPATYHTGRAPLEAASLGITLKEDEVAIRANFVSINNNTMSDYSAGHISTEEADILINSLNEALNSDDIKFYTGKSYRHLLIMKVRNPEEFSEIKTTPPHDIIGKDITPYLPNGPESQMLLKVMEKSKEILTKHSVNKVRIDLKENPANMLWLWGQGTKPKLPSFKDNFNIEGSIISAVDLVNGIGKLAGLNIVDVPNITGYYDTNYIGKAEYALKALKKTDFVYVHIEAPDEAGHNGDVQEKIKAIENIDKHILGTILNHYNQHDDMRILVLPDHPTPIALRSHTSDPVGFIMYGNGIPKKSCDFFCEASAKKRGLQFKSAHELTNSFIKKYL